jgi:hypothetical protein
MISIVKFDGVLSICVICLVDLIYVMGARVTRLVGFANLNRWIR